MSDHFEIATAALPGIIKDLGDRGRDADSVIGDAKDIISKVESLLGVCDVNSGLALRYITDARDGFFALQREVAQRAMQIAQSECNTELEKQIQQAMQPPKSGGGFLGIAHTILDGAGMIPVVQDFANPINGLIYVGQGDWVNAGISFGGMIPVAGDGFIAGRYAVKGVKDVNVVKGVLQDGRDAEQVLGDAGKIERGAGHAPGIHDEGGGPHIGGGERPRPSGGHEEPHAPGGSRGGHSGTTEHGGSSGSSGGSRGSSPPSTPSRPGGTHAPSRPPERPPTHSEPPAAPAPARPPKEPPKPPEPVDESPPVDRPLPGEPGSAEHKAKAWDNYNGPLTKDKWSNVYDANMKNATRHNAAAQLYKEALDWPDHEKTIPTPFGDRRIDILDKAKMRGVELKTGDQYAREEILSEIKRDEYLVEQGWNIVWVFKGGGVVSGPLKKALDDAGIPWVIEP